MNRTSFPRIICRRWLRAQAGTYARPIVRIASLGVAVSTTVMILAIAITIGFKQTIGDLVSGLNGHIAIQSLLPHDAFDQAPLDLEAPILQQIQAIPGVVALRPYAQKTGLIKTAQSNYGIRFKGYTSQSDQTLLKACLREGRLPKLSADGPSNEVLISTRVARRLALSLNEKLRTYFADSLQIRPRAFTIVGIFETGFKDFDDQVMLGDLQQIQRLNHWSKSQVEGFEITLDNSQHIPDITRKINRILPYYVQAFSMQDLQPELFNWLALTDTNVLVILILMAIVAAINVVTIFVANSIEKSSRIGMFRAMGASQKHVRRLLIQYVGTLTLKGMLWGNAVGLTIAWLQQKTQFLQLDPENYYMDHVPIRFDLWTILAINLGTLTLTLLCLWFISYFFKRLDIQKALHLDS